MNRSTVHGLMLALASVCLTTLALELAVRVRRGRVPGLQFLAADHHTRPGRMTYHPRLGWVPKPGQVTNGWTSTVDAAGIRRNGASVPRAGRPILAVGDSFTFGDEVNDDETWPAHLEALVHRPVLNAGVGAYGIDQAFLRAELLLDRYDPELVILTFISDDINRAEYSYYPYGAAGKPYFEYANGSLILRQVPVPRTPAVSGSLGHRVVRRALGSSLLADAVLIRIAPQWWYRFRTQRVHHDGERISTDLFVRLDSLARARGGRFIAVALATSGRIGTNNRIPNLVKQARDRGIDVLDLTAEVLNRDPHDLQDLFLPAGHYSVAMNRRVAERIAESWRATNRTAGLECRSASC